MISMDCLYLRFQHTAARRRLLDSRFNKRDGSGFNTQPPEGGCQYGANGNHELVVSTHSRPKAAARCGAAASFDAGRNVSTHSRPKAAARKIITLILGGVVSTHSRPKAAAPLLRDKETKHGWFQHTAARRRLRWHRHLKRPFGFVSTHSRPKAAATPAIKSAWRPDVSTHSRPKAAA